MLPILIAEDSDEDFETTVWALRRAKAENPLIRCFHGEEAWDQLRRQPPYGEEPRPCLVLLDLNLPRLDGRKVLTKLREHAELPPTPVVVVSTSTNPRDIDACYRLGVGGYLVKPVDLPRFGMLIQHLVDYWLNAVTLPEVPR